MLPELKVYNLTQGYGGSDAPAAAYRVEAEHLDTLLGLLRDAHPQGLLVACVPDPDGYVLVSSLGRLPLLSVVDLEAELSAAREHVDLRAYFQGRELAPGTGELTTLIQACKVPARLLGEGCYTVCPKAPPHCLSYLSGQDRLPQTPIPYQTQVASRSHARGRGDHRNRFRSRPYYSEQRSTQYFPLLQWVSGVEPPVHNINTDFVRFLHSKLSEDLDALLRTKFCVKTPEVARPWQVSSRAYFPEAGLNDYGGFRGINLSTNLAAEVQKLRSERGQKAAAGRKMVADECSRCVFADGHCSQRPKYRCAGHVSPEYFAATVKSAVEEYYGGIPDPNADWVQKHFKLQETSGAWRPPNSKGRPAGVSVFGVFPTADAALGLRASHPLINHRAVRAGDWRPPDGAPPGTLYARLLWKSWRRGSREGRPVFAAPLVTPAGNFLADTPYMISGPGANLLDYALNRPDSVVQDQIALLDTEEKWLSYWAVLLVACFGRSGWYNYKSLFSSRVQAGNYSNCPSIGSRWYRTQATYLALMSWPLDLYPSMLMPRDNS